MAKTCKACALQVFGGEYCKNHQWMREDKKPKAIEPKPIKPIPKQSDKMRKLLNTYSDMRIVFLAKNPLCKANIVGICTKAATEIHHMAGRGEYLLRDDTWLGVCRGCHQWIEAHPTQAKQLNLSQSRLKK